MAMIAHDFSRFAERSRKAGRQAGRKGNERAVRKLERPES